MALASVPALAARHIQDYGAANTTLQPHWGYASRVLPCTNDAGSCAYLDLVYGAHDRGMIYTGVIYATVGVVLLVAAISHRARRRAALEDELQAVAGAEKTSHQSSVAPASARLAGAAAAFSRRHLLLDTANSPVLRRIFGRTTRLQLVILAGILGYLLLWSFLGMTYQMWITPVKSRPGLHNTRSTLGPWSDRVGVLAFALTPFSVLLATRESLLSLATGVPYQHFNFLHRWLGHIIFVQSALHTIGWTIIEVRLYQPQPSVAREWIRQRYMIWGVVAMILLLLLWVLALPVVIRRTGYEFFRKAHYVLAMVYIGACWGHWAQLNCFLIPGLALWFVDRAVRLGRSALLHYNFLSPESTRMGLAAAQASITRFPGSGSEGDVLRLEFEHPQQPWRVGQHFFLCFPELSLWQSHPFTPVSVPRLEDGHTRHAYILRAKAGQTKALAALAERKLSAGPDAKTAVVLTGPYGRDVTADIKRSENVLCVAGGTGITYVLPALLALARRRHSGGGASGALQLVWVVRRHTDAAWVEPELQELRQYGDVEVCVCATRDETSTGTSVAALLPSSKESAELELSDKASGTSLSHEGVAEMALGSNAQAQRRPDVAALVRAFAARQAAGASVVLASGPGEMLSDVRAGVAASNDAARVWQGDVRHAVRLECDERMEW
ncbi:hypothetical protein FA09DRAFT_328291 [Tilletiopsis washingtonensis]|uniref:ferric-chelate reductase (NADPH) n=1 Tax=Tilletiopsis washingtonensis TaxID=58919 RepID=A0A316ZEJ6_9BASI|nr:hypothetical protein FA09DRAFT_328291 [Tilletiopsis washingtonensis]PWO00188.1 hypothetical protein FA09DRAFT_328291 [Tilletiopsis washingtonensis]